MGTAIRVIHLFYSVWHVELSFPTQTLSSASLSLAVLLLVPFPEFILQSSASFVLSLAESLAPGMGKSLCGPQFLPTSVSACLVLYILCLLGLLYSTVRALEAETSPYLSLYPLPQNNAQHTVDPE